MNAADASQALRTLADPLKAKSSAWFFKTGPGEYGYGDKFLGVTVPGVRGVAKDFKDLPDAEIVQLLHSPWHEERLLALVIWVNQFKKEDDTRRQQIYREYLANTAQINNWDLVDLSAKDIVGGYLYTHHDDRMLKNLAKSATMWERRIAVLATFYFLGKGDAEPSLAMAELLIDDEQDLMHKAVGWMLREMGKRVDPELLRNFLKHHAATMPRTTLRYAIEYFDAAERAMWLAQKNQNRN